MINECNEKNIPVGNFMLCRIDGKRDYAKGGITGYLVDMEI